MTDPGVPVVFVHVHYADVWADMAREIATAFDRPFGLVITCRDDGIALAEVRSPHLVFARRLRTENRGRDVLPFLHALREMGDGFELGLKLHTKRSKHRADGEDWRRYMMDSLLGGEGGTPAALRLMERDHELGLVAPLAHLLPLEGRIALNRRAMRRVADRMDIPLDFEELTRKRFAAGSMFWFRRKALRPFAETVLDDLFPKEKGQLDGTAAHAVERLFALVCERSGYWVTAAEALPDLLAAPQLDAATRTALTESAVARTSNPFALPISRFWGRHPYLLLAAHHAYVRTPRPVWRIARQLLRRFTLDR
jgi:lipopolysaccharide biosynthesis protein